jgi:hypothetical protein
MEKTELSAKALTSAQFEQLKRFIEEAIFEIELKDDDLVLSVDYQSEEIEGTDLAHTEMLASVGLRTVVGSFVSRRLDDSLDTQATRTELLAMAGRLREAAKFIERHAKSLNEEDWGMGVSPSLELIEYEEEGQLDAVESENGAESPR